MHAAYTPEAWNSFFVAAVGAAAALAGLLFVALSINLSHIISFASLPGRAAETIILLMEALLISAVTLIPGQSARVLGVEILIVSVAGWLLPVTIQARSRRFVDEGRTYLPLRVLSVQVATVPPVLGAVSLLAGTGGGLYWIGAGVLLLFLVSVFTAWVLLVEILR